MESDKLKTGDLVLQCKLQNGMPSISELSLIVWANNYIFVTLDSCGRETSQPQEISHCYQLLQRIDMYGAQDEV